MAETPLKDDREFLQQLVNLGAKAERLLHPAYAVGQMSSPHIPEQQIKPPEADSVLERKAEHDRPNVHDRFAIIALFQKLDLPTDDPFLLHFQTFIAAQRIYVKRYPKYRDEPIRGMGAKGLLVQLRTCVERLWSVFGPSTPPLRAGKVDDVDDAYDAINYAAHFINQMHARNNGTWGWDK